MTQILALQAHLDTVDEQAADVAILTLCGEDRPLPGFAGDLDWRALGRISRLCARGRFLGTEQESHLVSMAPLPGWPALLLYGLGERPALTRRGLRAHLEHLRDVVDRLRPRRLLLAPAPLPASLEPMFRAFVDTLPGRRQSEQLERVVCALPDGANLALWTEPVSTAFDDIPDDEGYEPVYVAGRMTSRSRGTGASGAARTLRRPGDAL